MKGFLIAASVGDDDFRTHRCNARRRPSNGPGFAERLRSGDD